ncbi:MAG: hypothetical protein ACYC9L_17425 [Sulfuricaulis sp.]
MKPDLLMRTNGKRPYIAHMTACAHAISRGINQKLTAHGYKPYESYLQCERAATTSIYIISDDDCIPNHEWTLAALALKLKQLPQVGILGLAWRPKLDTEQIPNHREWIDDDTVEVDYASGIIAVVRGFIKDDGERPETNTGESMMIAKKMRAKGLKVALWTPEWFIHIGNGQTTLSPKA